jgi:hypothetical protein
VIFVEVFIAALGISALYFMFVWLASAIAASYLSGRKGYGERIGLASGLILAPVGVLIWLIVPPKPESDWKAIGPFGRQKVTAADVPTPAAHQPSGGAGVSK